jgi:hypothetical protein
MAFLFTAVRTLPSPDPPGMSRKVGASPPAYAGADADKATTSGKAKDRMGRDSSKRCSNPNP